MAVLLSLLAGCSPGGPACKELAANSVFAVAMPGATAGGSYCSDPRGGIEGSTYGFATQVFGTDVDPAAVLEWHRATYESQGWTATKERPITLGDGHFPSGAWRSGDLIVGVGVLERDRVGGDPAAGVPGKTAYEVFITYLPRPSATSSP
jgi:hypothetical protein